MQCLHFIYKRPENNITDKVRIVTEEATLDIELDDDEVIGPDYQEPVSFLSALNAKLAEGGVVGDLSPDRLDLFLVKQLENRSRSHVQKLIRQECVSVNGSIVNKPSFVLKKDDLVTVDINDEVLPLENEPHFRDFSVVFEDPRFYVIFKPAGLLVHRVDAFDERIDLVCLMKQAGLLPDDGDQRTGIVHRLDQWTSGLMLVGRTREDTALLQSALQKRWIERRYYCLVDGSVKEDFLVIKSWLTRHEKVRRRRVSIPFEREDLQPHPLAKFAKSHFRTIRHFADRLTWLEAKLDTGRTHQIRAQLAMLHRPIVGDELYGWNLKKCEQDLKAGALGAVVPSLKKISRPLLHAYYLRFEDDFAKSLGLKQNSFSADLPNDFNEIFKELWGDITTELSI